MGKDDLLLLLTILAEASAISFRRKMVFLLQPLHHLRRGNTSKQFKEIYLKAKARIRP